MEELVLCKICNDCLDIKVKEMDDHPSRINGIRKGLNIQLYSWNCGIYPSFKNLISIEIRETFKRMKMNWSHYLKNRY